LQDSSLLAYAHAQQGLASLDCHEVEAVEQVHEEAVPGTRIRGRTVENEFCFDCHVANEHTSCEEIMERTKDLEINPHSGGGECYLCYQMHR